MISKAVEEAQAVLDNIYRTAEKEVEDIIIKLKGRGNNMTNFEKYKDEILALTGQGKKFSIRNNKICSCDSTLCSGCRFGNYKESCEICRIEWLCKEAKPTLTPEERGFCKAVARGYIARDKSDRICFYAKAPNKEKDIWYTNIREIIEIDNTYFPFITWKDSEPWSIGKLLGLKVE